ncbi:MAG: sulfotransferase, partial [Actinomycetia bacterium]|nr:sulfotransferase [Actinomycetes bacterium]
LALEDQRLDGEEDRLRSGATARSLAHQHQAYLQRGQYVDQLARMQRAVGREQMLVLDSADFWSTPERDWPRVTAFLGLAGDEVTFERHNARSRAPMGDDLRAQLDAHYTSFDERLAHWWGRTPSWRR